MSNDLSYACRMANDTGSDIPARVRGQASWLLGQAARRARRLVREELAAQGLGLLDYLVLATLAERGGCSQAELVRMLPVDGSDMVAILATLEQMGLVVRQRDPQDARRKLVQLTPAARRRQTRLDALLERGNRLLLEPLSRRERAELVRLLGKLVDT